MRRRKEPCGLCRFHRKLLLSDDLMLAALGLLSRELACEKAVGFLENPRALSLEARGCIWHGARQETEEAIHLHPASPIAELLDGRRRALSQRFPRPILYVPLSPIQGHPAKGVLRFERATGGRPFSAQERLRAGHGATALAQRLERAEMTRRNKEQIKRFQALTELAAIFASSLRVEDGLKLILQGVQQHFALDRVRLYLVQPGAQKLRGELSVDMRGQVKSLRAEEMPMVAGTHRFVDLLLGSNRDPLLERYSETVLHLPLVLQGNAVGLLVVDNLMSQQGIANEDVGMLKSFAGQIALAVDNSRLFDEVQALSLYDSLTGLPVRRYFFQRLQEEIYRAQRFSQPLSLALLDLDYYKEVNDTYGHQVGDDLLREVGRVLSSHLRKIDFPCRYGGDEILILLPQSKDEDACAIMTRLAQRIREIRIPVPFSKAKEISVTASIGVATYPEDGRTAEDLIAKADEALYWVKSRGKNAVASCARSRTTAEPSS